MNLDTLTKEDLTILVSAKELQEKEMKLKSDIHVVLDSEPSKAIDLLNHLSETKKKLKSLISLVGNPEDQKKYFAALNVAKEEKKIETPVHKSSDKVSGKKFKKYYVTFDWSYGGRFLVQNENEEKVARMISHLMDTYNLHKYEINRIMMVGIWSESTCDQYSFGKTIERGQFYIPEIKKNIRAFLLMQNVVSKKTEAFLDRI